MSSEEGLWANATTLQKEEVVRMHAQHGVDEMALYLAVRSVPMNEVVECETGTGRVVQRGVEVSEEEIRGDGVACVPNRRPGRANGSLKPSLPLDRLSDGR
jgi:hypothetical protein